MTKSSLRNALAAVLTVLIVIGNTGSAGAIGLIGGIERVPSSVRYYDDSSTDQSYFLYVPENLAENASILVDVHGISRNIGDHLTMFIPFAEQLGFIILAPVFSADEYRDYQRLGRTGQGERADLALLDMIEKVRRKYPNTRSRVHLFGYSGGAQFVHRFAMAHPDQVERVVIGAAGWYTMPTTQATFPYGTAPTKRLWHVYFDPAEYLNVPMHVLVGDEDTARSRSLNKSRRVDSVQGLTRLDRARNWVGAMHSAASSRNMPMLVTMEILPEGRHSFTQNMSESGMGQRVVSYLFDHLS